MVLHSEFANLKERLEKVNTKFENKEQSAPVATAISLNANLNATLEHIIQSNHGTEDELQALSHTVETLEKLARRA